MPTRIDRVEITYTLKFSTPFHCGTGVRAGLIDRTVRRDNDGNLYVPGSSIKGSLRERCEQLERSFVGSQDKNLIASPHDDEAALRGLGLRPPAMVTRVFGSHNQPGRLFFDDARLFTQKEQNKDKNEDKHAEYVGRGGQIDWRSSKMIQTTLSTQVRLNRLTHTAVDGALYTSEFGNKEMMFEGNIQGWLECVPLTDGDLADERHPGRTPTYSLLLLLAGLSLLDRLGGNKSTGKGGCTCEITELKLKDYSIAEDTQRIWLDHLDALANYKGANR